MDIVKPLITKYHNLMVEARAYVTENHDLAESNGLCNNHENVRRYADAADYWENKAVMYEDFIKDLKALDADLNWK